MAPIRRAVFEGVGAEGGWRRRCLVSASARALPIGLGSAGVRRYSTGVNPGHIAQIAAQMRRRPTDQLLSIWRQNDQDLRSPEAFEAIRQVLIERQIDPPRQGPALIDVRQAKPAGDEYWMRWRTVLLWIGLAIATVEVLAAATAMANEWVNPDYFSLPESPLGRLSRLVSSHGVPVALPLLLCLGIALSFRRHRAGRALLLTCAALALAAGLVMIGVAVYRTVGLPVGFWSSVAADCIQKAVHSMIFPILVVVLMLRSAVKSLFIGRTRGFDPTLAPIQPCASSETPSAPRS